MQFRLWIVYLVSTNFPIHHDLVHQSRREDFPVWERLPLSQFAA